MSVWRFILVVIGLAPCKRIQLIFAVGIRNPETGIRNPPLWYGIRNPEGWNPESRCWDPESEAGIRNPGPSWILLHGAIGPLVYFASHNFIKSRLRNNN